MQYRHPPSVCAPHSTTNSFRLKPLSAKLAWGLGGGRGYLRPAKSQLLLMAAGGAVDGGRVEQGYFRPAESKSAVGLVGVHAKI